MARYKAPEDSGASRILSLWLKKIGAIVAKKVIKTIRITTGNGLTSATIPALESSIVVKATVLDQNGKAFKPFPTLAWLSSNPTVLEVVSSAGANATLESHAEGTSILSTIGGGVTSDPFLVTVAIPPPTPPDPPAPPVNCAVSDWSAWSAWAPISQTHEQRSRTRTITTQPSGGGTACPVLVETETRSITPVPPPGPILSVSDLTWLGTFQTPFTNGISNGIFTGRRVGGALRFFQIEPANLNLQEFNYPGLGQNPAALPQASVVTNWGNIYGARTIDRNGAPTTNLLQTQLWWDETLGGMFWQYFDNYNVSGNHDPSLGFTELLNPSGAVIASYGPWRFAPPPHQTQWWIGRCPQAFADTHFGGRTLLVGSVGTSSGNASSSWGPALFSPQTIVNAALPPYPTTPTIAVDTLVGFSFANKAPRDATNWVPHAYPDLDASKWSQIDGSAGTGCWVSTATKSGVLFLCPQGAGHIWYGGGADCGHGLPDVAGRGTTGPHESSNQLAMLYVFDPAELARVITGAIQPHEAAWSSAFDLSAVGGLYQAGYKWIRGMWFDDVESRLYVSMAEMGPAFGYVPYINVYQVG